MNPQALRNATWSEVLTHVTEDMQRVHAAWRAHGPGTTLEIAQKAGISLLTFRPRTTDLFQCGLVECIGKLGTSGVYEYRTEAQAEAAALWKVRSVARKAREKKMERTVPASVEITPANVRWAAHILGAYAQQRRKAVNPSNQTNLFPAETGHAA